LKVTVSEWNWEGAPENPTKEERIKHYMESDDGRPRLHKMLGFQDWVDLQNIIDYELGAKDSLSPDDLDDCILELPMAGLRPVFPAPDIQSIMSVCRESHNATSKIYNKSFATCAAFPETLFDFRKDTLYLRYDTFTCVLPNLNDILEPFLSITDSESLANVDNLAILLDPNLDQA
jgi:hypothetical protein